MNDLRLLLACLFAGLLIPLSFPHLPSLWWLLMLLPVVVVVWRLPYAGRGLSCLLGGLCWALVLHHVALAQRLDSALDGQVMVVEGRISGLPEQTATGWRFELTQTQRQDNAAPLPDLRMHWWSGKPVVAGEWWWFEVRLRRPRGMSNPGSFDYEAWLYAAGTGGLGSVRNGGRLFRPTGTPWREALRERFSTALAPIAERQRLLALLLGDKSVLNDNDWQVLQATGTSHLMVISGLHVGLVALTVFWFTRQLLRWGRFAWAWPQLWLSAPVALGAAAGYAVLSGLAIPVQRALLMCALVCLMQLCQRKPSPSLIWLVALVAVTGFNPAAPLRAGFWLSFMAVGVLIFGLSGRLALRGIWARWGSAQWVVYLGLWPWLVLWGMPSSVSALVVNLLAIPCLSLLILPLGLLGALLELVLGWPWLLQCAGDLLTLLFEALAWVADFSPVVHFAFPGWPAWGCALAGSLLLLCPCKRLLWLPASLCLLPLLLPTFARPEPGQVQLTVLDVGQGLAVHVQTAEHDLLYDAGARLSSGFDLGEAVVLPALQASGVSELDMLLISHADNDHAGGALAVQQRLPTKRVVSGEPERLPPALGAQACEPQRWNWDGVEFELLWAELQGAAANDRSCVLQLRAGLNGVLLPGDISQAGEYRLIPELGHSSVLLAPHHGSTSSSSYAFIRRIAPRWVVFSAGAKNRYAHPHPKVVARYRELSVEPVYTAVSGAVRFWLDAQTEPRLSWRWRDEARRFWHEQ